MRFLSIRRDEENPNPTPGSGGAGDGKVAATPPVVDHAKALAEAQAEIATLKTAKAEADAIWDHTQKVLLNGSSPESAESLRTLLRKAGYSTPEIEALVNPQDPAPTGGNKKPTGGVAPKGREEAEGEEPDPRDELLRQYEARLKAVEGDTAARGRQDLEARLDRELEAVIASDADLKVLLEKAVDPKAAREFMVEEMRHLAKAGLRSYTERTGGRLDTNKFSHYAQESAKQVGKKFRSVIGAPQQLGRSPETDSGVSEFLQSKPVELAKGRTGGDGRADVTAFINDQLTRALVGNSQEESRL